MAALSQPHFTWSFIIPNQFFRSLILYPFQWNYRYSGQINVCVYAKSDELSLLSEKYDQLIRIQSCKLDDKLAAELGARKDHWNGGQLPKSRRGAPAQQRSISVLAEWNTTMDDKWVHSDFSQEPISYLWSCKKKPSSSLPFWAQRDFALKVNCPNEKSHVG